MFSEVPSRSHFTIDLHPQAGVGKSFNCVFRVKEVVEAGVQAAGRYG